MAAAAIPTPVEMVPTTASLRRAARTGTSGSRLPRAGRRVRTGRQQVVPYAIALHGRVGDTPMGRAERAA
ncbi:hypothetical protein [Streptomyces sp. NPDC057854]|uniref:hypothetical protein n=1 Tax=unclassified Streptomyces TaxID=2593676 RepID=UPI0036BBCFA8